MEKPETDCKDLSLENSPEDWNMENSGTPLKSGGVKTAGKNESICFFKGK